MLKENHTEYDKNDVREILREKWSHEILNDNLFSELKLDDLEKGEGPDLSE